MDFIERWLHISPDGGNGASEFMIVTFVAVTIISVIAVVRRRKLPGSLREFLAKLGNKESKDRFDN